MKNDAPILVVDDKQENLVAFRAILENAGYEVVTSKSGVEALKHLMKNEVSLILMDVQMPEINGFETARLIRQKKKFAELPILFISATQLSDEFVKQGYSSDGYDYITKPVDSEILVNKIDLFRRLYLQQKLLEERNRAAEELNRVLQSNVELEVASKAKDEFLASISHELRTPLTAILGYCDILGAAELSDEHQQHLSAIKLAGENQLALVNDLLDMSKIQAGKFQVENEPYSVAALLIELESIYRYASESGEVAFDIVSNLKGDKQLIGDTKRIRQILINLLSNAFKFTAQGSVVLSVSRETDRICFGVTDTGIGIAQENLPKLFSQFEQVDQSITRKFGGTGLGLAISQSLADLMEGTIRVTSELGKGTVFTLCLPYVESERVDKVREVKSALHGKLYSGRVLVAEDTPTIQALLKMQLSKLGLDVVVANDGQEALERASSEDFDLIFMDMHMPRMGGLEATERIKAEGATAPIIALTANVMQEHRQQFHKAGADSFLEKPINTSLLHDTLRRYLSP